MQIEDKRKAKAKLQATCNSFAERNSSIHFANYLDDVQVWNYAMSGFKRGIEKAGMGSIPTCILVLNYLKFSLFAYKLPNRQAVVLRKCQLAGHKRAGPKTENVSHCLQFVKIALWQCKHGCKKRRKKKRKKGKLSGC
jgi:hypothetical protein